ncbi:hypothetical protein CBR_g21976 [Chara braunii]|uniref:Malectin-like domain-containing protein n=1 Tax=Chara braunii TaxID=69332 RepID=A0A388L1U4_CHABU|nr:hypothetical protein CBR_g21976 [Chara braunii]|eukprot:GBG76228.1 hypothetical protein CBR_g21976 [Chara braunii]
MGTNSGPEIANLTLYWDEARFVDDLQRRDLRAAQRYAFTYRLIDDVLSWGHLPPPSEDYGLEWKETTTPDGSCTFLGAHLQVRPDGSLRMSVFDEAAEWSFPVIRYPSAASNVPAHQPAGVFTGQLTRFEYVCNNWYDFKTAAAMLTRRMLFRGHSPTTLAKGWTSYIRYIDVLFLVVTKSGVICIGLFFSLQQVMHRKTAAAFELLAAHGLFAACCGNEVYSLKTDFVLHKSEQVSVPNEVLAKAISETGGNRAFDHIQARLKIMCKHRAPCWMDAATHGRPAMSSNADRRFPYRCIMYTWRLPLAVAFGRRRGSPSSPPGCSFGHRFRLLLLVTCMIFPLWCGVAKGEVSPTRLNCGGLAFEDGKGLSWEEDNYYVGGNSQPAPSSASPYSYQERRTYRQFPGGGKYVIPAVDRQYYLVIVGVPFYGTDNLTSFGVALQGREVARANINSSGLTGSTWREFELTVMAFGTSIEVEFVPGNTGNPRVGAIQLLPIVATPALKWLTPNSILRLEVRLNCGGNTIARNGSQFLAWESDDRFLSSANDTYCENGNSTVDPLTKAYGWIPREVMQSRRIGVNTLGYQITLSEPSLQYFIALYFGPQVDDSDAHVRGTTSEIVVDIPRSHRPPISGDTSSSHSLTAWLPKVAVGEIGDQSPLIVLRQNGSWNPFISGMEVYALLARVGETLPSDGFHSSLVTFL